MFSPLHHHHRPTTERRNIKKNFRGGFLNFIKQNYTDFEEERLREKRKNVCFHHYIIIGHRQREEIFFLEKF
jgi:hypothetical protein